MVSITQAAEPGRETEATSPHDDQWSEDSIDYLPSMEDGFRPLVYDDFVPTPFKEPTTGHVSEWSGETLVASDESPIEIGGERGDKVSTFPRRLFASQRSNIEFGPLVPDHLTRSRDHVGHYTHSCVEAYGERSSSAGTVEVRSPARAPQTPVKRIKIAKKPGTRPPWQSPSQEDFSPSRKYRMRAAKSACSSPDKENITPKKLPDHDSRRCSWNQPTKSPSPLNDGPEWQQANCKSPSPDISDRSWMSRRDIPSSRWFPSLDPKREPFWTRFDGKVYLCFPSHAESQVYEVEVHAKIYLCKGTGSWYTFSIPGLPDLPEVHPGGRITFLQERGSEITIDKTWLDQAEDSGPYCLSGSSHFGSGVLLRLGYQPPSESQPPTLLGRLGVENIDVTRSHALIGRETRSLSKIGLYPSNLPENTGLDPIVAGPLHEGYGQKPPDLMSPLAQDRHLDIKHISDNGGLKAINGHVGHDLVCFVGLYNWEDPLEFEDIAKLAWDLNMGVDRLITGELECYMSFQVSVAATPLLIVNARDWVPDHAVIDGQLAIQNEWREMANGDMVLQNSVSHLLGKAVHVEIYWKEDAVIEGYSHGEGPQLRLYRLPHIVDKVILNGSFHCTIDGAILELNDYRTNVSWQADTFIGCTSTKLPKLRPGYRIDLTIDENCSATDDELKSLPHMHDEHPSDVLAANNDCEEQHHCSLDASTQTWNTTGGRRKSRRDTDHWGSPSFDSAALEYRTLVEQVCIQSKIDRLSRSSSHSSLVDEAPEIETLETTSYSARAAAIVPIPFTGRQIVRWCLVMILSLHLFQRLKGAILSFSQDATPQVCWHEAAQQGYGGVLDDLPYGLDVNRATEEPAERQEHAEVERRVESDMGRVDAEAVGQEEPHVVVKGRSWRDSIDYALGWREIRE